MKSKLSKVGGRRGAIVALLALSIVAFSGGAFVTEFRLLPYRVAFAKPFAYVRAMIKRKTALSKQDAKAKNGPKAGHVVTPATAEAYAGYTFMTHGSGRPSTARLLDLDGTIVHQWERPLSKIMPNPAVPDSAVAWRYGQLFPNGDIIVNIKAFGQTPDGLAMAKLDKDSNLIWVKVDNFHHHFSVGDDGRIYGLTHQWRNTREHPVSGAPFLPELVLEDFVVVLSPDGKELARASLIDALTAPGYRELYNSGIVHGYEAKDWDRIHPNDVEVITRGFASRHPFAKPGMVLVSLRELDALIVLDVESKSVKWVMRGGWQRQHDPDLLENGNLLLYDNRGLDDKHGYSHILELAPDTGRVVWSYVGSSKDSFSATKWGGEQRLPNGNTLILVTSPGHLFEVTPAGSIVWSYRDVPIYSAMRVPKDWVKFVPKAPTTRDVAAPSTH